jgi:protein-S-isoprenylcysteine O-methyltransferase Ste14
MRRLIALLYGCAVYLLFLTIFLYMIGFVEDVPGLKTLDSGTAAPAATAGLTDFVLLGVFALQHSVMARQGFKRWWTRIVPPAGERSTFVLAASLGVALLIWQWRPLPELAWTVDHGVARYLLIGLSALGWALLLASTFLIDHFELFGLRQVYAFWRGRRFEPPSFRTPRLYKLVRHPIYLGFLLAFWAAPRMTQGHLLFAAAMTAYIFIGIFFEERDLIAHFGDDYRRYRRQVRMIVPIPRSRGAASTERRSRAGIS